MTFSEAAFKARILTRARQLQQSVDDILKRAGVSRAAYYKGRKTNQIDVVEKIATACGWSLPEAMGFENFRISRGLLLHALALFQTMEAHLPPEYRTLERRADVLARLYDQLADRVRRGEEVNADYLQQLYQLFVAILGDRAED